MKRKLKIFLCLIFVVIMLTNNYVYANEKKYLACGIPVGIYLKTDGILVVGTSEIKTKDNKTISPSKNILKSGDYIQKVNQTTIKDKNSFIHLLQKNKDKSLNLTICRNNEVLQVTSTPVLNNENRYMLGIWARDDSHGIGTLTCLSDSSLFGTLGHGISDVDTGNLLKIQSGKLYPANIHSIIKGERGTPGSISGSIYYDSNVLLGDVKTNTETGVTGNGNEILQRYVYESLKELYPSKSFDEMLNQFSYPIAPINKITTGKAQIISSVSGTPKFYEIEILELNKNSNSSKSMVIKVTDPKLLELTGGIIQGMSGSPIIQNDKLIGAVTHVLVNEPTKGYGIFIQNMMIPGSKG